MKHEAIDVKQAEPVGAARVLEAIDTAFAVIEFDLLGNIIRANANFLDIMGYEAADLQGQHHRIFCSKTYSSCAGYRQFWEQLGEGRHQQGEFSRLRKDGREVWLQASYSPVLNVDGQPERIVKVAMDVTDRASVAAAAAAVAADHGGLEILVNNAGIGTFGPHEATSPDEFDRLVAVNLTGIYNGVRAFGPLMRGRPGAAMINLSSVSHERGGGTMGNVWYGATKAAVISFTQSAGLNLIAHGINVNAIAPGVVDGEHWDGVDAFFAKYENKPLGQKKREVGAAVPFGRMGTAADLTGMAIFLATAEAKYIVAQCFGVDGGNWMA